MTLTFLWDEDDDLRGNVAQLRRKGLTKDDIEHAFERGSVDPDVSNLASWPTLFGHTLDGSPVAITFRWEDLQTVYVIDALAGD